MLVHVPLGDHKQVVAGYGNVRRSLQDFVFTVNLPSYVGVAFLLHLRKFEFGVVVHHLVFVLFKFIAQNHVELLRDEFARQSGFVAGHQIVCLDSYVLLFCRNFAVFLYFFIDIPGPFDVVELLFFQPLYDLFGHDVRIQDRIAVAHLSALAGDLIPILINQLPGKLVFRLSEIEVDDGVIGITIEGKGTGFVVLYLFHAVIVLLQGFCQKFIRQPENLKIPDGLLFLLGRGSLHLFIEFQKLLFLNFLQVRLHLIAGR